MKLINFNFQGFGSLKMRFTKGTCSSIQQGKRQEGNDENRFNKAKNLLNRYKSASITSAFCNVTTGPTPLILENELEGV